MTEAIRDRWALPEDGETRELGGSVYVFSEQLASDALEFIQRWCRHPKGRWAGQPLELQPWQVWFVGTIFGWVDPETRWRQYRTAFLFVPRKNGKSTLAAAIGLYLLMADGEMGAEVYSAAADTQQAQIVHRVAELMARKEPRLESRLTFRQRNILYEETASIYRVLSADAHTKHGFDSSGVIFDELHTQPDRNLWDVLDTSTVSRAQPLVLAITTAGVYDEHSIVWEVYDYAKSVAAGEFDDPSFLPLIFEAEPEDDWTDPETWAKANPNYGVSVPHAYLKRKCDYAKRVPASENTFKRLHLNLWTEQSVRWLSTDVWKSECLGVVSRKGLEGQTCFVALDLSSTKDITTVQLIFPREEDDEPWPGFGIYWVPKETIRERAEEDRVPYDVWARQGLIETTPGNVTDYAFIRKTIHDLADKYQIAGVGIDPWNATQLAVELENDGLPVVMMRQGYASMTGPSKEFERRIVSGGFIHPEEDAVMTWMIGNVAAKTDPAGNIKPDKSKSGDKIDGVVAKIMATGLAMTTEPPKRSIYESEELTII